MCAGDPSLALQYALTTWDGLASAAAYPHGALIDADVAGTCIVSTTSLSASCCLTQPRAGDCFLLWDTSHTHCFMHIVNVVYNTTEKAAYQFGVSLMQMLLVPASKIPLCIMLSDSAKSWWLVSMLGHIAHPLLHAHCLCHGVCYNREGCLYGALIDADIAGTCIVIAAPLSASCCSVNQLLTCLYAGTPCAPTA